ncbi:MAG: cobalt ECF transporter T component CbiQ [Candidatus Hydrogenedentes bacterium]|nr:cobalt ECF transporter T component CbiQ [Candidatus Hydrogenedentota bacterium]
MISATIDEIAAQNSPIHRLDARVKICAFVGTIFVSVSTRPAAFAAFAGYLLLALVILLCARVPLVYAAKRSLVVIPFALLAAISIPFMPHPHSIHPLLSVGRLQVTREGLLAMWNVAIKAYVGVVCLITLSTTTPFPKLLQGLEQLWTPKLVTLLVSFLYRYLFVLTDEALRMKRAAVSRGYRGRWIWQARTVGHLIGTLFLRSYERGERVCLAMASRGFTGKPTGFGSATLRPRDYAFLLAALSIVLLLRWRA